MKKNSKSLVIMGLIALCVILTAGVYFVSQSPKGKDEPNTPTDIVKDVTPSEITDTPDVVVPDIKPTDNPTNEPTTEPKTTDIPLTQIDELTKKTDTTVDTDKPHDVPKTEQTPTDKKEETKPKEPTESTEPKSGDKNSNGEVYVPDFGWVKDSGANDVGTNDSMYENGNKVGVMD